MRRVVILLPMLVGLCLLSCSSMTSRSDAYLTAPKGQKLVMGAKQNSPMQQPYYPIPRVNVTGHPGSVSLLPPGSKIRDYQK